MSILIALGHSGYELDIQLAENIPELDLVVGGHSHTFLYTDTAGAGPPSVETAEGEYPTYVTNTVRGAGQEKVIPVVQAFCYTKYLGHLQLSFDSHGELLSPVAGAGVTFAAPVLLDHTIERDPAVLAAMEKWQQNLTEYRVVVGENMVFMEEGGPSEESNIGECMSCMSICRLYRNESINPYTLSHPSFTYDDL